MSDSNTSPLEKLWILLRKQWILISATLTSIAGIISTIFVALTGGGGSRGGATSPKDNLVAWVKDKLKRLSVALKRLAGKAVEALPGIIGSVINSEQFLTSLLKLLALQRLMSGLCSNLCLGILSVLLPPGYIVKLLLAVEERPTSAS